MIDINNSQDFDAGTFAEELAEEQKKHANPFAPLAGGTFLGGLGSPLATGSLLGGVGSLCILSDYGAVYHRCG